MPPEPMLGLHVSIAESMDLAFDRAQEVGANTMQIFTRNPNRWAFNPIPNEIASLFKEKRVKSEFKRVVDHMPYLPNLASPDRALMKLSRYTLSEELKRCDTLDVDYLVVHLGSHLGKGTAVGVANIAGACNEAIAKSDGDAMVLLENMAGQKNCVGARFEEIRAIIDKVKDTKRVGVCLDSCHLFAAGFDLRNDEAVSSTIGLFDVTVGLDFLKVLHLNDSKGPLGSRLDRHENIGKGKIGAKGLGALLCHKGTLGRPIIMETPYEDVNGMKESMAAARRLLK
jgi:deoxyribonuclease-4